MINYTNVKSSNYPKEFEITKDSVIIASNIQPYQQDLDGITVTGYEYDYTIYNKDEYLTDIAQANAKAIVQLSDELAATKILLGVE